MRIGRIALVLLLVTTAAYAGPNQDGVLVVHSAPELATTASCADLALPSTCSQLVPQSPDINTPVLWFVIAAFPNDGAQVKGLTFGLGSYDDSEVAMSRWGACSATGSAMEIPDVGWPGPNSSTSIVWSSALTGRMVPVYSFVSYAYASAQVPLARIDDRGKFGNANIPADLDSIAAFGQFGFGGAPGTNPCR